MGVRQVIGEYDGTTRAAVMVDSSSGFAFGPVFEGDEAEEQLAAFLSWMSRERWLDDAVREQIGLEPRHLPAATVGTTSDPRQWPDGGLERLVLYWRRTELVDGYLPAVEEGEARGD